MRPRRALDKTVAEPHIVSSQATSAGGETMGKQATSKARLEDMIVFARVYDAGSLTRAARALGSTRSAVSKAILRLEDHMGTRLFQRTTRVLSATAAGHA